MTQNEIELINIIRHSKNKERAIEIATAIIADMLKDSAREKDGQSKSSTATRII